MNTWNTNPGYYRASLPVQFLPSATFVYQSKGYIAATFTPCIALVCGTQSELASEDVIVIGDQQTNRYLLVGALTAFRSVSIFRVLRRGGRFVSIEVEQPEIKPGEPPEEIMVSEGNDWRELLFQYADAAAKKMGVKPITAAKNITGYCTWYYYYQDVTGQNLLDNVKALAENREPYAAEYVQIDDGYQRHHGDWLDRKDSWPFTLESAAQNIISHGMKAGIWLMPFVASTVSRIYREHPDWLVQDPIMEKPVIRQGWSPEPETEWCCLDTSIPEVNQHIAHIFKTMWEMGYSYFKLDGLSFGMTRGLRRDQNMTVVESFRRLLKTIREAVPDALLMACSEPFMPCLGFFDNARVSYDTSRYFDTTIPNQNFPLTSSNMVNAQRETMANFWKFDRWFRCDPDSLMARQDNAFYTEGEARFSVLTGILTGISITSDNLATIAPERLALLGIAQKYRMYGAKPFRWCCGQWAQFFEGTVNGQRAVAVFNDSESDLKCDFTELGLPAQCVDLLTNKKHEAHCSVPRHDAALLIGIRCEV